MTSVSVVPIVDTSYSMTSEGYVAQTVIDTKAFLRLLKPGDKLAVVAYDTTARNVYTSNGSLATVDLALTVTANAAGEVDKLSFTGGSTAIGLGLQQTRTFLDSASLPKACVLLTDGFQNEGPPPLDVLPSYPVMACAMGPHSDQDLLKLIAQRTGGEFFYAPRAADMMKVYNKIRSNTASAALLANQLVDIPKNDYRLIPATVSQRPGGAQISAVWSNAEVTYTRGSPSGNQLSVTLVDPSGSTSPLNPTIIGNGFVIYNVDNPAPGNGRSSWNSLAQVKRSTARGRTAVPVVNTQCNRGATTQRRYCPDSQCRSTAGAKTQSERGRRAPDECPSPCLRDSADHQSSQCLDQVSRSTRFGAGEPCSHLTRRP